MRRSRRRKSWFASLFSRRQRDHETPDDAPSAPEPGSEPRHPAPSKTAETASVNKAPADLSTPEGIKAAAEAARRLAAGAAPARAVAPVSSPAPAKAESVAKGAADPLSCDDIQARVEAARRLAAGLGAPAAGSDASAKRDPGKEGKDEKRVEDKSAREPRKSKAEAPMRPASAQSSSTAAAPPKPRAASGVKDGDADAEPASKEGDALTGPTQPKGWLVIYWRKVGGGSLVISLGIHLVFLVLASFIVTSVVRAKPAVDFLPGGGSKAGEAASQDLAQQVKMRKRTLLNKAAPVRKVVANTTTAAIALPEIPMETMNLPVMSSILGGSMGSGGFGDSGAGGGHGAGMGIGGMSGRTFKPISMFGKNLNARSIAVILDVSGSMTPHLRGVVEELDRVARGSPVVLYVGCGVDKPPGGMRLNDDATETRRSSRFRSYWTDDHGPETEVYSIMEKRPSTYFIKSQGIQYAWIALLTAEVRNAEALYWFSDFQDDVDDDQMASVLENLKRRKQKLFIHASDRGSSFEKVRDQICLPSGGMVIAEGR